MEANDLFKKVSRRSSYECKDQLFTNRMITKDCKSKHRNLSMTWIDYCKAFDSVPHNSILKALNLFQFSAYLNFNKFS